MNVVDVLDWIRETLRPRACTSDEFIYDDMDSQSSRSLPVVYRPFDPEERWHWVDRGQILDFLFATRGAGKRLLDFGPGDGWPSLGVARFAGVVVGVDASARRVEVCSQNARRLGISNAKFVHAPAGTPLPFGDATFDGVMAASSVEQTPDPKFTLRELCRVLKPGGRLRIGYEALGVYRNGKEREIWVLGIDDRTCRLVFYDRHIDEERADQYGLTLAMSRKDVADLLRSEGRPCTYEGFTVDLLERLRPRILDARACTLRHPSGRTLAAWLTEAGFSEVIPSHGGGPFAGRLFDNLPQERRPRSSEAVEDLLAPLVQAVVDMPAPMDIDPMITAVK